MKKEQLQAIFNRYQVRIEDEMGMQPSRVTTSIGLPNKKDVLRHLAWMIREMRTDALRLPEDPKVMRWLGFVQGALWVCGVYSIDAIRDQNR